VTIRSAGGPIDAPALPLFHPNISRTLQHLRDRQNKTKLDTTLFVSLTAAGLSVLTIVICMAGWIYFGCRCSRQYDLTTDATTCRRQSYHAAATSEDDDDALPPPPLHTSTPRPGHTPRRKTVTHARAD